METRTLSTLGVRRFEWFNARRTCTFVNASMEVRSFGAVFALHNHSHHPARSLQSLANVRKFVKTLRGEIDTTVAIGLPILRKFIGMKNHVTFGHSNLCFV